MLALLKRNLIVLKRSWHLLLIADVLDNLIWLCLFVFGFAAYMPDINGVTYAQFVIPGYFLMAGLYQQGMEATSRLHAKLVYNPWWNSLLVTPLSVRKILYGEALWVIFRGSIPVAAVYILARFFGVIVNDIWFLMGIPLIICLYAVFTSISMLVTMIVKNDENFIYYWVFVFSPVFVASGAFYERSHLPEIMQTVVSFYPFSFVILELQKVMLWGEFNVLSYSSTCLAMLCVFVTVMRFNEWKFKKRFLS